MSLFNHGLRFITSATLLPLAILGYILLFSLTSHAAENDKIDSLVQESVSLSLLGTPKYAKNFHHFDYANPDAPKGGQITLPALGTYDNFNLYALRGHPLSGSERLYDSLFALSEDEINSLYPLIGLSARYTNSYQWMEVTLNPAARFQDGTPIHAEDAFTFNKFMTEGVPQFRSIYKGVTVKAISPSTVRFKLPKPDRDRLLSLVGGLPVFPKHFWQQHNLGEPLNTPPLGSGPYAISDYKLGQYIVYQRLKNYWAADLPVNRGRYNFNILRYDYYLDDNVALEAFKAGAYDLRVEPSPKKWATQYQGKNFERGYIVKKDLENLAAKETRWLAFNVQRPLFAEIQVRKALALAFDFAWMNKALFYRAYLQPRSFFQDTPYEATGLPDSDEQHWLLPFKDKLPADIFSHEYQLPPGDDSGYNRKNLLQAAQILQQAGWEIRDNVLVNSHTDQPFTFELLLPNGSDAPYALPFQQSLARLGIKMTIRTVDSSQYINRLRSRDFDMMPRRYPAIEYPSTDMMIYWNSAYIDATYNTPGFSHPAVDDLTQKITEYQGQEKPLLSLGRALDRVLTGHYVTIPMWYANHDRFSYWRKYGMPQTRPKNALGIDTWWYDAKQAAQLPEQRR